MKRGDKVKITGEVKWKDEHFTVFSEGIIEEWKRGPYALVNVKKVGNDCNVCVSVKKVYLKQIDD